MDYLSNFSERFSELILENETTPDMVAATLGVTAATIYRWQKNKIGISLLNIIKIADYFNCSLEFLIGRTDNKIDFTIQPSPPFYERLRQVMLERNITWYRIVKDGVVSNHNLSVWKNGTIPYLQSVIGIADYFKLTLDQFVGRER
ncbi:MAG: helix-turn-helix domain-containing protein [Firmicutes bacterium]|nr:helix-turn-helix domain-containing protein [Bacillota bacterium]